MTKETISGLTDLGNGRFRNDCGTHFSTGPYNVSLKDRQLSGGLSLNAVDLRPRKDEGQQGLGTGYSASVEGWAPRSC